MTWNAIAPILLLFCSNVFMTFAWVSRALPEANEMVRWTISTGERRELGRAARKQAQNERAIFKSNRG